MASREQCGAVKVTGDHPRRRIMAHHREDSKAVWSQTPRAPQFNQREERDLSQPRGNLGSVEMPEIHAAILTPAYQQYSSKQPLQRI